MKMKMFLKNRSHKQDINTPRHKHRHRYAKYNVPR